MKTTVVTLVLLLFLLTIPTFGQNSTKTIHVFVALCDNEHQSIVPVSPRLGKGDDPANNLYWGALYGVKTFFKMSDDWKVLSSENHPKEPVLERYVFKYKREDAYLVADAYRGSEIKSAITDFLDSVFRENREVISVKDGSKNLRLEIGGGSSLVAYVGHNGLMDFSLEPHSEGRNEPGPDVIILACASKDFFAESVHKAKANPILWTTSLMAPEAYTLKNALDGWISGESPKEIQYRAAKAYQQYQKCSLKAALNLLVTGW
jgi:hypothetical protein